MSKPAILTVDDDPLVSAAITRDLRRQYGADYRVVRATSGAEALEVLTQLALRDEPVALIVADQRMPRMTGIELLAAGPHATPPTPSSCCSPPTPTPTWRSRRSTTSASTTTCSSRGTRPRSGSTRSSTTCSATGGRRTPTTRPTCASSATAGPSAATRSRRSSPATTCPTAGSTSSATTRPSGSSELAEAERRPTCRWCWCPTATRCGRPRRSTLADALGLRTTARAAALRPVHRRRRAGRAGGRGLRRLRGPAAPSSSSARRPAGRPGRAPRSRTTSASPAGSPAPTSPTGRVAQVVPVRRRDGARPRRRRLRDRAGRCAPCCLDGARRDRGARRARRRPASPTGGSRRRGLDELTGRGVYYGATASEAGQCEGDDVYVVGAANSAGQAALNLARYAKRVVLLVRGADRSRRRCRSTSSSGSRAAPNIEVRLRTEVVGGPRRRPPRVAHARRPGHRRRSEEVPTNWLFVFIGACPAHRLARRRRRARRARLRASPARTWSPPSDGRAGRWPAPPFALETSVPGVFAAGDVRLDSMKRVASAVGEGAMSVYLVHRYLATI